MEKRGKERGLLLDKRGQVTIFVIVAIVIVAAVILFFTLTETGRDLRKDITGTFVPGEVDVREYLDVCISENNNVQESIDLILSQGGSTEPGKSYMYEGMNLEYLCYTNEYFERCVMQQPLIVSHIEGEILGAIGTEVESCVRSMVENLRDRGYTVEAEEMETLVNLEHSGAFVYIDYPMTVSKGGVIRYDEPFRINLDKDIYELIILTTSILNYEARYGDSDPVLFMALYPQIKVEKFVQGEGSTVYILTNRESEDKFSFATRSLVLPPGYVRG